MTAGYFLLKIRGDILKNMKKSNLSLKESPTLQDFQQYIVDMEKERDLQTDISHYCLLLGEEVGELFKAIRKKENHQIDHNSKVSSVDEELADVFIFVCAIANKYNVDLEKAFREKEQVNKERSWNKST